MEELKIDMGELEVHKNVVSCLISQLLIENYPFNEISIIIKNFDFDDIIENYHQFLKNFIYIKWVKKKILKVVSIFC